MRTSSIQKTTHHQVFNKCLIARSPMSSLSATRVQASSPESACSIVWLRSYVTVPGGFMPMRSAILVSIIKPEVSVTISTLGRLSLYPFMQRVRPAWKARGNGEACTICGSGFRRSTRSLEFLSRCTAPPWPMCGRPVKSNSIMWIRAIAITRSKWSAWRLRISNESVPGSSRASIECRIGSEHFR